MTAVPCVRCGHLVTDDETAFQDVPASRDCPGYDEPIGCVYCLTETADERDWDDVLRQRIEDGEVVL